MSCGVCNAPRCIYSNNAIGASKGLINLQAGMLDQLTENGYVCRNQVAVGKLYAQGEFRCGDTVDSNYCNPSTGTKGSITVTEDVCSVCYLKENIVDKVELMRRPEVTGKDPLSLCGSCFDLYIQCPIKKWRGTS